MKKVAIITETLISTVTDKCDNEVHRLSYCNLFFILLND